MVRSTKRAEEVVEINLKDVEKELSSRGFAVREGNLPDLNYSSLVQRKWKSALQKSGATVFRLRPMDQEQAPPRSLSAVHGLGAQPLHTDGAHLRKMPDVVVLYSAHPNSTGTTIWKLGPEYPSAILSGVFTVRGNEGSFLAHAFANQRLRYDPVCMSPADQLAKEAKKFLGGTRENAHTHTWSDGKTLLFIDNRRALHGREAVADASDAQSRLIERVAYYLEPK
ncbi:MAG: TauD/TfdA family dioxygenase [Cryobacterium sp.]|nr:TauD/TfdA family dioxygenase [Cryobacterium sp.]